MDFIYWKILLLEWRKSGGNGLTIPFIIGSQEYLPENHPYQNIKDLIMDIANNNEHDIYITYCLDLNEIILGVREGSKINIAGKYLFFQNGIKSNIFLTNIADDLGEDVETLITELSNKYEQFIFDKTYSINDNQRGQYSIDEINFIQNCIESKM